VFGLRSSAMAGLRDRVTSLPLRWQIGSLVVLGLVTMFVLFDLLGRSIAQDAKDRTISGWASIATSTATVIDSQLGLQFQRLEEVATVLGAASSDPASQRLVLDRTIDGVTPVDHLVLVAPDGRVLWPSAPGTDTTVIAADPGIRDPLTTGARHASRVIGVGGRAFVVLAVPVNGARGATSVVALVFAPAEGVIGDLISSARGLAHTGHAELVDQDDRVIVSSEAGEQLGPGEHPDLYDPHLAHHTSGVGLTEPVGPNDPADQGQRHDMAFISLRSVPWGLALGGSDAELSADAARWEGQTIALGTLSLLVALLLVWVTTRSVARPVLALAAASRQIASGDLATPVPVVGEGEVRARAGLRPHAREAAHGAVGPRRREEPLRGDRHVDGRRRRDHGSRREDHRVQPSGRCTHR